MLIKSRQQHPQISKRNLASEGQRMRRDRDQECDIWSGYCGWVVENGRLARAISHEAGRPTTPIIVFVARQVWLGIHGGKLHILKQLIQSEPDLWIDGKR
jgi:putative heme degradation protein